MRYTCSYATYLLIRHCTHTLANTITCTYIRQKTEALGPRDIALGDTPKPHTHTHTHSLMASPHHNRSFLSYNRSFGVIKRWVSDKARTPVSLATIQDSTHWATMTVIISFSISLCYNSWCPWQGLDRCSFVTQDSSSSCRAIADPLITIALMLSLCIYLPWPGDAISWER